MRPQTTLSESADAPAEQDLHGAPRLTTPRAGLLAAALASGVVLLRVVLSRRLSFCGTPDACYYLGMAQSLAAHGGFHARFLFDLQQVHPTLPNTGIEYWRPGISLLLALLRSFGGATLHGSIVVTILVGVLFSSAAWHIARRFTADARIALGGFALCLLASYTWIGSATPDSGLYYGAAVAWFLALFTVRRQGLLADILALICVGLAYLIRNDAVLLLFPLLAVLLARLRSARAVAQPGSSPRYLLAMLLGFVLALVPMHLLYHAVLGTAFPGGTSRVLYLDALSDFGRYHDLVTPRSLWHHGIGHLVAVRIVTLLTTLYRIAVLVIGFPALIFFPCLWLRDTQGLEGGRTFREVARDLPELIGALAFLLPMLFLYTLVLPAIGGFSALRSVLGVMPLVAVLAMLAMARITRTHRMASWLMIAVVTAYGVTGLMEAKRDLGEANLIGAADQHVAQQLVALGATRAEAVVLTNDPVQFAVTTGFSTVALPSNGLDAIAAAAHDFHATHVILDSNNLPASPAEMQRRLRPVRSATLEQEHSLILELARESPGP